MKDTEDPENYPGGREGLRRILFRGQKKPRPSVERPG